MPRDQVLLLIDGAGAPHFSESLTHEPAVDGTSSSSSIQVCAFPQRIISFRYGARARKHTSPKLGRTRGMLCSWDRDLQRVVLRSKEHPSPIFFLAGLIGGGVRSLNKQFVRYTL